MEREFELFRMKLEDKTIKIQNLLKRIDVIAEDLQSAVVATAWKDIYTLENLRPTKSMNTFLSILGEEPNLQQFMRLVLKGGELSLFRIDPTETIPVLPLLRCTETYVSSPLQQDEELFPISQHNIYCTEKIGSYADWTVAFISENPEEFQFEKPILIKNLQIGSFPYQLRFKAYVDSINRYPYVKFYQSEDSISGTITHSGKELQYLFPRLEV